MKYKTIKTIKQTSLTELYIKAFIADFNVDAFFFQKFIKKYEKKPIHSQKNNSVM